MLADVPQSKEFWSKSKIEFNALKELEKKAQVSKNTRKVTKDLSMVLMKPKSKKKTSSQKLEVPFFKTN